jgi:hypothetical protein
MTAITKPRTKHLFALSWWTALVMALGLFVQGQVVQ